MSEFHDRAVELRAIITPHYNCCQSVAVPFAERAGVEEETVMRFAANFGLGMKRGSACGAIAGGLVVLGLFGVDDPQTIAAYYQKLRERHEGYLDCADLLRLDREKGHTEKKPHCDAMVYECVDLTEEILKEKGKL